MSSQQTSTRISQLHETLTAHCKTYRNVLDQVAHPQLFSAVRCILEQRREAVRQLKEIRRPKGQFPSNARSSNDVSEVALMSSLMRGGGVFLLHLIDNEESLLAHYEQLFCQPDLSADLRAMLKDQCSIVELNLHYLHIEQRQAA